MPIEIGHVERFDKLTQRLKWHKTIMLTKVIRTSHFEAYFNKNYSLCSITMDKKAESVPGVNECLYDIINTYRGQQFDTCRYDLHDELVSLNKDIDEYTKAHPANE